MLDTVRRYVEAGREVLTPGKAEELARALIQQGQARADQAGRVARDLIEWSRKNSERFRDTVRHEVQKQLSKAGVASKEEVDGLKRRIRELESAAKSSGTKRTTTQRSAGGRTATAPKGRTTGAATTRRSTASRSTSRGKARKTTPGG